MGKDEKEKKEKKREKDEDKMDEDQDEDEDEIPAILSVIAVPLAKDKLVKKLLKLVKAGKARTIGLQNKMMSFACAKSLSCMLGMRQLHSLSAVRIRNVREDVHMCDFEKRLL
jgi:hypothetical protein